ncbi:MAG TPA: hypothetical protein VNT26_16375 [Candidatus Sulfotelmatobacter sp.]|nr:hypothetical protein [Candidatus Sulfotelmatobacter sp.]HWI56233.1 hypothetical protein [Bacillota bacterium]
MGLLKLFAKSSPTVQRLPAGSMTVDCHGDIVAATIASSCEPELLQEIAHQVLGLFRGARAAQIPLAELTLHFASLQITAREMRGGAIIFISPKNPFKVSP